MKHIPEHIYLSTLPPLLQLFKANISLFHHGQLGRPVQNCISGRNNYSGESLFTRTSTCQAGGKQKLFEPL